MILSRMTANAEPSKPKPRESFTVKAGSVELSVYSYHRTVNGAQYPTFELVYYVPKDEGGRKRVRRLFSDEKKARKEANAIAAKLSRGEVAAASATGDEIAAYGVSAEQLAPFGKSVSLAIEEYIEVLRLLPAGTTAKEAVVDFAKRRASVRSEISTADLVEEYIEAKRKAGLSDRHLKDLRFRLGRFAKQIQMPVSGLTAPVIEKFLDGLGVSNRSRINEIITLASLCRHAVKLRYASGDLLNELAAIQRPKAEPPPTLTWQPNEFRELLESAPVEFVPFLVFGGLCGMRTSEITRSDWSQLTADRKFIAVITRKGRTPARRLVPICPAALEWITPYIKESGPICHTDREDKIVSSISTRINADRARNGVKARFQWRNNALRHSYGTFRVALTGDISRTSLEMGNSPRMVTQHYLQLATKEQAEGFFAIAPRKGVVA